MPLTPGTRLGVYEIVAPIGRGGMGEVFRAVDTELRREVAVKVLPDVFAADSDRLARFRREAQILASLNHPNIASIYGIQEADGVRALILELELRELLSGPASGETVAVSAPRPAAGWLAGAALAGAGVVAALAYTSSSFEPPDAVWRNPLADAVFVRVTDFDAGDPMFVADRTGADSRQIFTLGVGGHNHFPTWSPDGQWIYFVSGIWETRQMDVWRVSPDGGAPERLTRHDNDVRSVAPLDARTVLYVSPDDDGAGPWLWALDVPTKSTRRISSGVETYTSVAASADGVRIVATVENPRVSVWSVPMLDRPAEDRDAQRVTLPSVRAHVPRFGGKTLFYLASSGSGAGLWRQQDGEAVEIWKAADGRLLFPPAVSPDGRRIVLVVRKDDKLRLQVISADGAEVQATSDAIQLAGAPRWSPDSQWIVTAGRRREGARAFQDSRGGRRPRARAERYRAQS